MTDDQARLYALKLSKKGATKANGKMCEDCAFIPGTNPNMSPVTIQDALDCIHYEHKKFYCHNENKLCTGFRNAILGLKSEGYGVKTPRE